MSKNFLNILNHDRNLLNYLINSALEFKQKTSQGIRVEPKYQGMSAALVFEKPSLRTKITFELACTYFGITPIFLSSSQILASGNNQQGRESIPDIGRNLERFVDLIIARVYQHAGLLELSDSVKCPVINALCDRYHPTQAIADLTAIKWHKKNFDNLKVTFIGDGNNVATSLLHSCVLLGINFSIATPAGYEINSKEKELVEALAQETGSKLEFIQDPQAAVKNADVIYTDTFTSMGQEAEHQMRLKAFKNYQVDQKLLSEAKADCLFMHCLPAHRGEEVSDEVMDGKNSIIFDQAECKLHAAKAIIDWILEK